MTRCAAAVADKKAALRLPLNSDLLVDDNGSCCCSECQQ